MRTAEPGIRPRVVAGCNRGQPIDVVRPAFRMTGALLGMGQAGVGQAQQRSFRLFDEVDFDEAPGGTISLPSHPKL